MLIGFGHKARQGKNTAALAFLEECPIGEDARLVAFADALRAEIQAAARAYGSVAGLIDAWKEDGIMPDWVFPEYGKQRSLYQWWGTDFRRAQDENYWIKRLRSTLRKNPLAYGLITDVRFPNEAEFVKSEGGILVKVTRTTKPDVDVPEHPSEQALDGYTGWHHELVAGSVKELQEKTRALFREIGGQRA